MNQNAETCKTSQNGLSENSWGHLKGDLNVDRWGWQPCYKVQGSNFRLITKAWGGFPAKFSAISTV